jgi:hypothetical protein
MRYNEVITLNIKGRNWHFVLLGDRVFDKRFPCEEENEETQAITVPDENSIYLKKSRFTLPTIRHEIFHILVFSSLIESSSLDRDQMEELGAEITAEHSPEIVLWAEQVMNFYTQKGAV